MALASDRSAARMRMPGTAGLGVDETAAAEGPVLPGGLLEADHHVLGVDAGAGQPLHEVGEHFLFHLDAAAHRPQDLDEREVAVAPALKIRVAQIEAEVGLLQLDDALKLVGLRNAGGDERGVYGIEHRGLELRGLGLANGERDERHGGAPTRRRSTWAHRELAPPC